MSFSAYNALYIEQYIYCVLRLYHVVHYLIIISLILLQWKVA